MGRMGGICSAGVGLSVAVSDGHHWIAGRESRVMAGGDTGGAAIHGRAEAGCVAPGALTFVPGRGILYLESS